MCKNKNEDNTNQIDNVVESVMSRMSTLANTSVVIGSPIVTEHLTIIPISKVTMGFITGGGENLGTKKHNPLAAGAGAGYSVSPIGFAVISDDKVKILKIEKSELIEKLLSNIPDLIDMIKEKIK